MLFSGLFNHKLFNGPTVFQRIRSHEGSAVSVLAVSAFVVTILQIGMTSFLLSSFREGWTSKSRMKILSPMSRLLKSTSILEGMCSAGQRYFRLVLILFSWPPVSHKTMISDLRGIIDRHDRDSDGKITKRKDHNTSSASMIVEYLFPILYHSNCDQISTKTFFCHLPCLNSIIINWTVTVK